jgi:hypothetical protein
MPDVPAKKAGQTERQHSHYEKFGAGTEKMHGRVHLRLERVLKD